ncbi:UNVERIFIED_CONTAM: hypothetical protein PYX00_003058 [Menopon gallinae]|uniref:Major facilitator superfamily (MFS) profile domain-containing protein n=1 Tax=Menopon gallinae TaxID=328185 RepID=A0AAW2HZW7_9NEOP
MDEDTLRSDSGSIPRDRGCHCRMLKARVVLYMLSFTGFLVSFMMRTDMNIAMVAMAKTNRPKDNSSDIPGFCHTYINLTDGTNISGEDGEFEWSSSIQSIIISSFYWCYVVSQVVGGILTQVCGTKIVFGVSQLVTAVCSLFIPWFAELHWAGLIVLRSIQGLASGLTWPAMYAVVGHWIPIHERSRFMSSFQGFSFGIGLTYMLGGVLISNFGWRVLFYITGSLGVVWCIFWFALAYDTPEKHPRITSHELMYIQSHIGNAVVSSKKTIFQGMKVPWKDIFRSMPAWSIGITTFGRIWVHYTFMIPGPKYMKNVLGLHIQENGAISGAPFICSYFSSVIFCVIADKLHQKELLDLTTIRKINTAISQVLPGLLLLLIGYLGCQLILVFILWFIAVILVTAAYAGAMASIVDIAPNLAGPVLAFAQTIHMSASFISPLVAGAILEEGENINNWRIVFGVAVAVACFTYLPYYIWGTARVQDWNYPGGKQPIDSDPPSEVLQPLQPEEDKNPKSKKR